MTSQIAIDPSTTPGPAVVDDTWDNRDRLTSVTDKDAAGHVLQVVNYTYDVYNRMIGKALAIYDTSGDQLATRDEAFVYDGDNNVILAFGMGAGDYSGTDFGGSYGGGYTDGGDPSTDGGLVALPSSSEWALTDRYLWVPGTNQILADELVLPSAVDGGASGSVEWGLTDNQYTVRDILLSFPSDDSFSVWAVDHIGYTPFGAPQPHSLVDFLFEFQGEMYDQDTGLQSNAGHWYDPVAGRWISPDKLFPVSGLNPYEALDDAPSDFVDPSGLEGVAWSPPSGIEPGGAGFVYVPNVGSPGGTMTWYAPPSQAQLDAQAERWAEMQEQDKKGISQDSIDADTLRGIGVTYDEVCAAEARLQVSQLWNAVGEMNRQGIPWWEQSLLLFVTPASVNPNPFNLDAFSGMFYEVPGGTNSSEVYSSASEGDPYLGAYGGEGGEPPRPVTEGPNASWGNPGTLQDHFNRHGADFGSQSPLDYSQQASDFLQQSQADGLPTKIGEDGTIRVYDPGTDTFGAYNPDGTTKTLFQPTNGPAYWNRQPGTAPWSP